MNGNMNAEEMGVWVRWRNYGFVDDSHSANRVDRERWGYTDQTH